MAPTSSLSEKILHDSISQNRRSRCRAYAGTIRVTRQSGTERPGTGEYLHNKEPGIYVDIGSGEPLFASTDKSEAGCGWPSFTKPIETANVAGLRDTSHGMIRNSVVAATHIRPSTVNLGAALTLASDTLPRRHTLPPQSRRSCAGRKAVLRLTPMRV